jgi:ClpP class serine protease
LFVLTFFFLCSEFQTVTAGKFKRTLTPTKKVTKADLEKSKEDLEEVLGQFSGFVKKNRPSLDIEAVATGETWFGDAALERGLCDEIKTVDDVLLNYVDLGYNVYEVEYNPPQVVPEGLAQLFPAGAQDGSLVRRGIRWAVSAVVEEARSALDEKSSISQRYMAKDDTSDRVQARD